MTKKISGNLYNYKGAFDKYVSLEGPELRGRGLQDDRCRIYHVIYR
jgi:hypothetical protein